MNRYTSQVVVAGFKNIKHSCQSVRLVSLRLRWKQAQKEGCCRHGEGRFGGVAVLGGGTSKGFDR